MRLAITFLGLDLFTLDVTTDAPTAADGDPGWALNGGTLATDRIDAGPTDCFMGFTAGMED